MLRREKLGENIRFYISNGFSRVNCGDGRKLGENEYRKREWM